MDWNSMFELCKEKCGVSFVVKRFRNELRGGVPKERVVRGPGIARAVLSDSSYSYVV